MDLRLNRLQKWVLDEAAANGLALVSERLVPVSGDASFRRYFRAEGRGVNWIAVDAPPEKEDSRPFVAIARNWRAQGIRVPTLIAIDLEQGFMLLEDFGDRLLLGALDSRNAPDLYRSAMDALLAIQSVPAQGLPRYDEALLRREMALFDEWLLELLLELELDATEREQLAQAKAALVARAVNQLQVSVHRDYHSRNLMVLDDGELGVIDFQDAVEGPITYDLVSLFRDSYVRWPDDQVSAWVEAFRSRSATSGVPVPEREAFLADFDLMGMQRQLKVLGIFSRLYLRDGKAGYLQDIPRTLGYLYRATGRHAAMSGLRSLLENRVIPAMQAHALFSEADLHEELC